MKIKKKGFVSVENIYASSDEAFEYRPVVEVEYEIDSPELDMLQAAAVIAKGGKVQQVTNSNGDDYGTYEVIPYFDGSVLLYAKARYIEVPR